MIKRVWIRDFFPFQKIEKSKKGNLYIATQTNMHCDLIDENGNKLEKVLVNCQMFLGEVIDLVNEQLKEGYVDLTEQKKPLTITTGSYTNKFGVDVGTFNLETIENRDRRVNYQQSQKEQTANNYDEIKEKEDKVLWD